MLHLTFQIVCALIYAVIAGIYYWLVKREIRKRRVLEQELVWKEHALKNAEAMADSWASKYSRLLRESGHKESAMKRLEEEVTRLKGLLMTKQGASEN